MHSCHNQPRSSDSNVDLEYAATLKDLREMTITEREYESPQEKPTLSFTVPNQQTPLGATSHVSRASWKASQKDVKEKMVVFKDDVEGCQEREHRQQNTSRNNTSHVRTALVQIKPSALPLLHSRSKSDSAVARTRRGSESHTKAAVQTHENGNRQATTGRPAGMIVLQDVYASGSARVSASLDSFDTQYPEAVSAERIYRHGRHGPLDTISSEQDLIAQLRNISDKRAQRLKELQALDEKERHILNQLGRSIPSAGSKCTRDGEHNNHVPALTRSLSALPLQTVPLRLMQHPPSLHPLRTAPKPTPSRRRLPQPISALPRSMPLGARHHTPSVSKRFPIADKTEASHTIFEVTPLHTGASRDLISANEKEEFAENMVTGQGKVVGTTL